MGHVGELGWGVPLSRGEVDSEMRELNPIGGKRLTRRAAQWPILVVWDLRRFSQSGNAVVRIAYLHRSTSSMNLDHRSYRSLSAQVRLIPWNKVRRSGGLSHLVRGGYRIVQSPPKGHSDSRRFRRNSGFASYYFGRL